MTSSRWRWPAVAALLLVSAGFARLGFWQLSRLHQRRALNAAIIRAGIEPRITLNEPGRRDSASLSYRRLEATGRYDGKHDLVLRGQAYLETPGIYVVTPLRLAGSDTALLVLRGFVPAPDAVRADLGPLEEPGEHRVTGLAEPIGSGGGRPLEVEGRSTWARLDLPALRDALPYPLLPVVLRQAPDSALPRYPRRLDPPEVDDGPHLNYAVQWFLFAAMGVAFAVVVVARGGGARRAP
ncbi:MAG TPA: SURF1 family protein [Gemmatimonadales bacterium]|nr:SURF1 family protein [Gemmatimonadales bacterium]